MTSSTHTPAPDVSSSPPFASADDLLVFDLTAILRVQWFLNQSHLASNVVSTQHGPSGNLDWVEFAPPFHTHLIKCATALLPPQLCSMKRLKGILFAYVLKVLNLPVSTLAQFKRKTLSKKVCPQLDPTFKPPPPAGRGTAVPTLAGHSRPSPPLLLPPLSSLSAPSPWLVTPLPPLHPCPRLMPRVQHPRLLPCLMCRMRPPSWPAAWPVSPPLPPFLHRRHPNALHLPFPTPCALCLVPMVLWESHLPPPLLPVPHVPVT